MSNSKAAARRKRVQAQKDVDETRSRGGNSYRVRRDAESRLRAAIAVDGALYHDGQNGYLFLHDRKVLCRLDRDDEALRLWLAEFGILAIESLAEQLIERLRLDAVTMGRKTDVHYLSYYSTDTGTLYLSQFDGSMVVLRPDGAPEIEPNGYDGVLFIDPPGAEPIAFLVLLC
jgi:hypothetical protein